MINAKPSHEVSNDNEETLKEPSIDQEVPVVKKNHKKSEEENKEDLMILEVSMKMDSPLPQLGTMDLISARRKEELQDAVIPESFEMTEEISGLKTVTEKDLIFKYEEDFKHREQIRQENRKVLEWGSDSDMQSYRKIQDNNQKLFNNNAISIIDNPDKSKRDKNYDDISSSDYSFLSD